jgi:cell wall-associated NlpC family hydrolase
MSISEIAKQWQGTPWRHNQSVKGVGCDCVGFLLGVGKEAGVISPDYKLGNYHRIPRFNQITQTLDSLAQFVPVEQYQPEDILLFKMGNIVGHIGLALENEMLIHADMNRGVQIISNTFWVPKIYKIYRICQQPLSFQ